MSNARFTRLHDEWHLVVNETVREGDFVMVEKANGDTKQMVAGATVKQLNGSKIVKIGALSADYFNLDQYEVQQ